MSEPDYVAQTFEAEHTASATQARAWFDARSVEARAKGCTFARYSEDSFLLVRKPEDGSASEAAHTDGLLFEAWKVRPDDQGEQRWSFATMKEPT